MNRRPQGHQPGLRDRIAAFAQATEVHAESLEDPDLANVYWGKSLGLWQALTILSAEDGPTPGRQPGRPAAFSGFRRADPVSPSWEDLLIPPADPPPPGGPPAGEAPEGHEPRRTSRGEDDGRIVLADPDVTLEDLGTT